MYMYMYMYMYNTQNEAASKFGTVMLSERGLKVHLYESRLDIRKEDVVSGRSINLALSHRGREALRAVGLEDEVLAKAIPMRARKIHTANGKLYSIPYVQDRMSVSIYSVHRRALRMSYCLRKLRKPPTSQFTLTTNYTAI